MLELRNLPSSFLLVDHDAPVLCVTFDPEGEYLVRQEKKLTIIIINLSISPSCPVPKASSSCDGTVRVWSVRVRECVQELSVLPRCSEVASAPSLCQLAWGPAGKVS